MFRSGSTPITMIENEIQYQTTKAQVDRFEVALAHLEDEKACLLAKENPIIWEATKQGIRSVLEDLTEQLVEYESDLSWLETIDDSFTIGNSAYLTPQERFEFVRTREYKKDEK